MAEKEKDRVLIENGKLSADRTGQPVEVSRQSYEKVWKGRGWRLATSTTSKGK